MARNFTPTGSAKLALAQMMLKKGHDSKHHKPLAIGKDCSICIHSQTQKAGKGWAIICTKGITVEAKKCEEFKDARKPRTLPPIMEP